MSRVRSLLAATLLAFGVTAAQAQPPVVPTADPHHPGGTALAQGMPSTATPSAKPPAAAGPVAGQPTAAPPGGMMGGMMGGDMGGMMQSMMRMMAPERIEGRLAFLRTELAITEAQQAPWNAYAEVMRSEAKAMHATGGMTPGATPMSAPDRMDMRVKNLGTQVESAKAAAGAVRKLYSALSDTQKKTADELLGPPMGRM